MSKNQSIDQFCASNEVIRKYIDYVEAYGGNPEHHFAWKLVNETVVVIRLKARFSKWV